MFSNFWWRFVVCVLGGAPHTHPSSAVDHNSNLRWASCARACITVWLSFFSPPTLPSIPLIVLIALVRFLVCFVYFYFHLLDVSRRTLPLTAVVDQALDLTCGHNPWAFCWPVSLTVTRLRWSRVAVDVIVFFRSLFPHKIIWLFFESIQCMKIVLGKMLT